MRVRGKAALLQRDVWSREMLARLDNRWIATSGVCAGSGAFKGLKHAVSHNRFAVRGRGERLHTEIDDRPPEHAVLSLEDAFTQLSGRGAVGGGSGREGAEVESRRRRGVQPPGEGHRWRQ